MFYTESKRTNQQEQMENNFSTFGNVQQTKLNKRLHQKLNRLKLEQKSKSDAIKAHKRVIELHALDESKEHTTDDDEYWIVDSRTCQTTSQKCVLWHLVCLCTGMGVLYLAIELALQDIFKRIGGELIPILMGVFGGIIVLDSSRKLWKDMSIGLCPCQEVLDKRSTYKGKQHQGKDLEASISLAHARANHLNRQAMALPTVEDLEASREDDRSGGGGGGSGSGSGGSGSGSSKNSPTPKTHEMDANNSDDSWYSSTSEDTSSDEQDYSAQSKNSGNTSNQNTKKKKIDTVVINEQKTFTNHSWTQEPLTNPTMGEDSETTVNQHQQQQRQPVTKRNSFAMDVTSSDEEEHDTDANIKAKPNKGRGKLSPLKSPTNGSLGFRSFKTEETSPAPKASSSSSSQKKKKKKKKTRQKRPLDGMIPHHPSVLELE